MIIIFFLTAVFQTLYVASSNFHTWTEDHKTCITRPSSLKSCFEMPYIKYVHHELHSLGTNLVDSWKYEMLKAIDNLYVDLKIARVPSLICIAESCNRSTKDNSKYLYPISFGIPRRFVTDSVPYKEKAYGRVIPGNYSTYFTSTEEDKYRDDMAKSLFAITYKKAGWDCLRHYEIMAAGCLPLFIDIDKCPSQSISALPKNLLKAVLNTPGLPSNQTINIGELSFNMTVIDKNLYTATTAALLQYCKNVLSTRAIAEYVISIMLMKNSKQIPSSTQLNQKLNNNVTAQMMKSEFIPKSILFLTHQNSAMDRGDYQTDFLLHGLINLFGRNAIVDYPPRNLLYKTTSEFTGEEYHNRRKGMYGKGFSFGLLIDDFQEEKSKNQTMLHNKVIRMIQKKSFDLIIVGSGHRDGRNSILPFWNKICIFYPSSKVAWIEGGDEHIPPAVVRHYSKCADHLFSREGSASKYIIV